MKAVMMAGGFGSRLYPLTVGYPKPMIPLVNKPVLAHILNLLKLHDFSQVIITVRYLAHQIQDYFGDGSCLGMKIHYAVEDTPLGTAGGVKNTQPYLDDEPFLVISGDILTDINLSEIIHFHGANKAKATLALKEVIDPQGYGLVMTDTGGRITAYLEKPDARQIDSKTINSGIYVLEPEILDNLEPEMAYDFSYDVFPGLLAQGTPIFGKRVAGYWRDIGTLQSYSEATFDVLTGKVKHIDLGRFLGNGVWVGHGVEIAPDATLRGPLYLAHGVKIDHNVTIIGPAVIGHRTVIDRDAYIEQAIIGPNCLIGKSVSVRQTLVPPQSILTTKSKISERLAIDTIKNQPVEIGYYHRR